MSRDMLTLSKIRYTENRVPVDSGRWISTQYNKRFYILFNELKIAVPCQLLQRSYYTRPNDIKFHEIMSNSKIKTFKNLCICFKNLWVSLSYLTHWNLYVVNIFFITCFSCFVYFFFS